MASDGLGSRAAQIRPSVVEELQLFGVLCPLGMRLTKDSGLRANFIRNGEAYTITRLIRIFAKSGGGANDFQRCSLSCVEHATNRTHDYYVIHGHSIPCRRSTVSVY